MLFHARGARGVLLKAVYRSSISNQRMESDPVQVFVIDPSGDDLEVWRAMRTNPRLGYLLQTGVLVGAPPAEEDEAVATLEVLLSRYPTSAYARQIGPGLQKFRVFVQRQRSKARQELP